MLKDKICQNNPIRCFLIKCLDLFALRTFSLITHDVKV